MSVIYFFFFPSLFHGETVVMYYAHNIFSSGNLEGKSKFLRIFPTKQIRSLILSQLKIQYHDLLLLTPIINSFV